MKYNKIMMITIMLVTMIALATGVHAFDEPTISMSVTSYEPGPAQPGDTVEVWVKIENTGTVDANNLVIEYKDSYPFKLLSEDERITTINKLDSGSKYLINYKVKVDSTASQGTQNIQIQYSTGNDAGTKVLRNLPIDISNIESPIAVTSVKVEPETLVPGAKSKLIIGVKNLAKSSTIKDLSVSLGLTPVVSSTTILIDLPFVPINGGSQKAIDKIIPGQTTAFEFEISTYPDAVSKLYKVPVTLSYKDEAGVQYNKTVLIGLEVNAKPDMLVSIDQIDINTEMSTGNVVFGVTNRGISDMKLLSISLEETDDYEILSPNNEMYLGNIASDDFETAKFEINVKKTGTIEFPVSIKYKDALNNNYKQDFKLEYKIRAPDKQQGSPWPVIIIILIIIVVVVLLLRRKKKKQSKN